MKGLTGLFSAVVLASGCASSVEAPPETIPERERQAMAMLDLSEQDGPQLICFTAPAGAPVAYIPDIRRDLSVAVEQDYRALAAAWQAAGLLVPARMGADVTGHLALRQGPDGLRPHLIVTTFHRAFTKVPDRCPQATLEYHNWVLTRLGEQVVTSAEGDRDIFLRFDGGGRVNGLGGCNRFVGDYHRRRDHLDIGPLAATRMMCPKRGGLETGFFKALDAADRFAIEGKRLLLLDLNGDVVAVFDSRIVSIELDSLSAARAPASLLVSGMLGLSGVNHGGDGGQNLLPPWAGTFNVEVTHPQTGLQECFALFPSQPDNLHITVLGDCV